MKLTKTKLKKIIKEELEIVLQEDEDNVRYLHAKDNPDSLKGMEKEVYNYVVSKRGRDFVGVEDLQYLVKEIYPQVVDYYLTLPEEEREDFFFNKMMSTVGDKVIEKALSIDSEMDKER